MSAFAVLTLKDNSAANVTFNPLTIDSSTGVATWATADAIYDAKKFVTWSSRTPSSKSSKARLKLKVTIPIMDVVDTTKKVDEAICSIEIAVPRNQALTPRLDLKAFADTLLQNAIVTAFMTTYEGIY